MALIFSTRFRKFGKVILISVPTVVVSAAVIYKERNRPCIPEEVYCDLAGKICVISGATSGIGMATAIQLAQKGVGHIIIGSRDATRGEAAALRICASNESRGTGVEVLPLDLADSSSVDSFVKEVKKRHDGIDLLISAAAEIHNEPVITSKGMDATFCSNHLGLQQFVVGMEPLLMHANGIKDGRARVVVIGSRLESKGLVDPLVVQESRGQQLRPGPSWDNPLQHYADTKLANQLFVTEISSRWCGSIDVISVSPGMVNTRLWRHFPLWYQIVTYPLRSLGLRDPEDAAKGVVFAATAAGVKNGSFLLDGKPIQSSENSKDPILAEKLFKVCKRLLSND